jgi:hypothetical protein
VHEDPSGPGRLIAPVASVAEENIRADRAEVRGPHPIVRAVLGLLLGVVAGGVAALLTPRGQRPTSAAEGTEAAGGPSAPPAP